MKMCNGSMYLPEDIAYPSRIDSFAYKNQREKRYYQCVEAVIKEFERS